MKESDNWVNGEERVAAMGSFQKFCLRWNNHSSNFVGNLGSLLASEEYSDVTVCCQNEVWHLHQLVLSASSSHFAQLLRLIPPGQTPILILDGPPACDIQALIHFIYHGEVNVDQESLPSLLRTAASFRIKGLADVSALTGELKEESTPSPQEMYSTSVPLDSLSSFSLASNDSFDNISPLNLTCHRNHSREDNEEEMDKKRKKGMNDFSEESKRMEISQPDSSNIIYHPSPSKKIRIIESNVAVPEISSTPLIHDTVQNARVVPFVSTLGRQIKNHSSGISEEPPMNVVPNICKKEVLTQTSSETETMIRFPCPGMIIESASPKEDSPPYVNISSSNVSFPLPILKMSLSPQIAYQPSSTTITHPGNELSISMHNRASSDYTVVQDVKSVSNGREIEQIPICYNTVHLTPMHSDSQISSVPSFSPPHSTSMSANGARHLSPSKTSDVSNASIIKYEPVVDNIKDRTDSANIYSETVASESVPETTFTHKKFSACTIPQTSPTTKTLHLVKRSFNSPSSNQTLYNATEVSNKCTIAAVVRKQTVISPSEEIKTTSTPSIIKLTPVAVTTYAISKPSTTFPVNSVMFTTSVDSQLSDTSVISSSSLSADESNSLTPQTTADQPSPYLQSLFQQKKPHESADNMASSASQSLTTTTTVTTSAEGGGGTAAGAQRVTINMRTFKEEWRRQLLVDYDSNTNMSICMLCFTTFKSYDGPRKNTYVKHAKRFHPALEDYSEEERGVIISMYEKYHKYDIDMQKEINKSFRTTNNSGAALKRMRVAEFGVHMPPSAPTNAVDENDKEVDEVDQVASMKLEPNPDEKDSTIEAVVTLVNSASEPLSRRSEVPKRGRLSEKIANSDTEIIINNNNNNKNNRNKNDIKLGGESAVTSS